MKLSQITGIQPDTRTNKSDDRLVDSQVYVGIEIEIQGMGRYSKCPMPTESYWHSKEDGSLRNHGMEFITGISLNGVLAPIRGADLMASLDIWKQWVEEYIIKTGDTPDTSERTSVHIHVDVRDMEKEEVDRLMLLWAVFEPTFFKLVGEGRETNIHCKPFFRNQDAKRRASQIITSKSASDINKLYHSASKYEAMNTLSILNFGSMEFRIHKGTIDADALLAWINLLLMLRKAAKDPTISVLEMPEMASGNGILSFVGQVFQEHAGTIMPIITNKLFYFGVRQAQDIIHNMSMQQLHTAFERQGGGKSAGEESILHKWATANNRKIY